MVAENINSQKSEESKYLNSSFLRLKPVSCRQKQHNSSAWFFDIAAQIRDLSTQLIRP